ncbi:MAG: DUF167 domain-containing protein [Patescibacteria group bacterium]|nr:DUF167 domain-containing protein [Patescibacteria group bacterium]
MLIKVRVFPNSKKDKVIEKSKDSFDVMTREKPIKGQASRAMVELLSIYLKIPQKRIRLIRGFKKRNKILEILDRDG